MYSHIGELGAQLLSHQDARMAIFTRFSHITLAATLLIGSFGIAGNLVSVAIFARREVSFGWVSFWDGVREKNISKLFYLQHPFLPPTVLSMPSPLKRICFLP